MNHVLKLNTVSHSDRLGEGGDNSIVSHISTVLVPLYKMAAITLFHLDKLATVL